MNDTELHILQEVLAQSERKPSGLFNHLVLIKTVWEAGFGTPTVVKALERAGVTEGVSLPNVQGFIKRAQRDGLIGAKGSNPENRQRLLAQMKKQDAQTKKDKGSSIPSPSPAGPSPLARSPESAQPAPLLLAASPKTEERPPPSKAAAALKAKVEASRKKR